MIGNSNGVGVNSSDYDNVTVTGGTVSNFSIAIFVDPAEGINVSGMKITDSLLGVEFLDINNSFIMDNVFERNNRSVKLLRSDDNQITGNTFTGGNTSVRVLNSYNVTIKDNVMSNQSNSSIYLALVGNASIQNVSTHNVVSRGKRHDSHTV